VASFLRKVFGGFGGGAGERADNAFYYYLRCSKCGEVIRVRARSRVPEVASP